MLQAVENGKPILAPNIGLVCKRVEKNKIGLVYKNNDYNDLENKIKKMTKEYKKYKNNVVKFRRKFNKKTIFSYLDKIVS